MSETPALSPSIANLVITESPRHAWLRHRLLGNQPKLPTDQMEEGAALHALMLEQRAKIAVCESSDWRNRDAKAFRKHARERGKIPLTKPKYDALLVAASRITLELEKYGYDLASSGSREVKLDWFEPSDCGDVLCRGVLDWLSDDRQLILDLKTTRGSCHPDILAAKIDRDGCAVQEVAYRNAVEYHAPDLAGRVQFVFLYAQIVEPFCVVPAVCAGSMRELGESRWRRAIEVWARCLKAGKEVENWPPYLPEGNDPVIVEAPKWSLAREIEEEW